MIRLKLIIAEDTDLTIETKVPDLTIRIEVPEKKKGSTNGEFKTELPDVTVVNQPPSESGLSGSM